MEDQTPVDQPVEVNRSLAANAKHYDRLTMVLQMHHEHYGDNPHSVEARAWRLLGSTEVESWSKRVTVKDEWMPLPLGWVEESEVGYIVLENLEGKATLVIPSQEEKDELAKRIVQIGHPDNVVNIEVHPGFPQQLLPTSASKLMVRCLSQSASCRIHVFPK
jgi:hypothetical protein